MRHIYDIPVPDILTWRKNLVLPGMDIQQELLGITSSIGASITELAALSVVSDLFETKIVSGFCMELLAEAFETCNVRLNHFGKKIPDRDVFDPVTDRSRLKTIIQITTNLEQTKSSIISLRNQLDYLTEWQTHKAFNLEVLPKLELVINSIRWLDQEFGDDASNFYDMGSRDMRYKTFSHTRNYEDVEWECPSDIPLLIAQIRTQRDELDAVETFSRVVASQSTLTLKELLTLTSIISDEARHAALGERLLEYFGFNPRNIAIGTIGSEYRKTLDPMTALADNVLLGEAVNVSAIRKCALVAIELGEAEVGHTLMSIFRDETKHLKYNTRILKRHTGRRLGEQLPELYEARHK